MLDFLMGIGIDTEILVLFSVGALLVTLGFMFGSQWVSELGLAFAVANLLMQFAPLSALPDFVTHTLGFVPFIPEDALLFIGWVFFGWWVAHTTVQTLDLNASFARLIPASLGTLGIIFLTISHTLTLSPLYTSGTIAKSVFDEPLYGLLFIIACLALIGLSRKM
jgi:hypothetical protein